VNIYIYIYIYILVFQQYIKTSCNSKGEDSESQNVRKCKKKRSWEKRINYFGNRWSDKDLIEYLTLVQGVFPFTKDLQLSL
jgi:hypothetical protein